MGKKSYTLALNIPPLGRDNNVKGPDPVLTTLKLYQGKHFFDEKHHSLIMYSLVLE